METVRYTDVFNDLRYCCFEIPGELGVQESGTRGIRRIYEYKRSNVVTLRHPNVPMSGRMNNLAMSADNAGEAPNVEGASVPTASHYGELVNGETAKVIEKNRLSA